MHARKVNKLDACGHGKATLASERRLRAFLFKDESGRPHYRKHTQNLNNSSLHMQLFGSLL